MSSIDNRIVKMEFDNKQFESGTKQTMSTLEKLKESLKMKDAGKGLQDVDKAAKGINLGTLSDGINSVSLKFSALGVMGVTALMNITNAVINTGKKLVSMIFDPLVEGGKRRALNIEQAKFQFRGLGIDVEAAMASATEAVADTAYGLDSAAKAAAQFGASGMQAGDEMTKALRAISGLAAMTSSEYDDIANIFTTIAGNGRLMGHQLTQLSTRGVNAAATLAKEFGKTEEEIRAMVTKGQISFEMFYQAMDSAFGEHAKKANETYAGSLSNVKAALSRIGADVATQHFENMKHVFNSLIPLLKSLHKALQPAIEAWNQYSISATSAITSTLDGIDLSWIVEATTPLVEAAKNIGERVAFYLTPIKQAFANIFPPSTENKIVKFANALRDLTSGFDKFSHESIKTGNNIYRTFKGIFAAFDIVVYAVKSAMGALGDVLTYLAPNIFKAGDGILGFTANLGDWVVAARDAIIAGDFLGNAFDKIGSVLVNVINNVKAFGGAIKESFLEVFGGISFDGFGERFAERIRPLEAVSEIAKKAFLGLAAVLQFVTPIFLKLSSGVKQAMTTIRDAIVDGLGSGDFKAALDVLNTGIFSGMLIAIQKIIKNFSTFSGSADSFMRKAIGILDGVRGALKAYQTDIQAKTLKTIATAVAILAASIFALSLIDSGKLTMALGAITTLFIELAAAMAFMSKISFAGGGGTGQLLAFGVTLTSLAAAILILSFAMKNLANLNFEEITQGLLAIAGIAASLGIATRLMGDSAASLTKGAIGLIALSVSIKILANVMQNLAGMDISEIGQGLLAIGGLLTEIMVFMRLINGVKLNVGTGVALIALGAAIKIFGSALQDFGQMDTDAIVKGLAAMGGILLELAIFTNLAGNAKHVISTAVSLTIIGASMLIFAEAIGRMGDLQWEQIARGLTAMAGALTAITIAMNLMPKGMVSKSAGLVAIAYALTILADAMNSFGGMSWDEIGRGLAALGGSMLILALGMHAMSGAVAGAGAMLVMAAALRIFVPALIDLGQMSLTEIGMSLLALAGTFAVMGLAGLALAPVTPVLLALGAAVALFGIGALAAGVGITALSAGLSALAISGTAAGGALIVLLTGIAGAIPPVLKSIGEGFVELVVAIANGAVAIGKAFIQVAMVVIEAAAILIPEIIKLAAEVIVAFMTGLSSRTAEIAKAGWEIITELLRAFVNALPRLIIIGADIVITIMDGIGQKAPELVEAGFNLIIDFINGLADAFRNQMPVLLEAIANLGKAIIEGLVKGLLAGVGMVGEALVDLGKAAINGLKNFLGIGTSTAESSVAQAIGESTGGGFATGLENKTGEAASAADGLGKSSTEALQPYERKFKEAGETFGTFMSSGLKSKTDELVRSVQEMIDRTSDGALSRAEKFRTVGETSMAKYKTGVQSKESEVSGAVRSVIDSAGNSAKYDAETKLYSVGQFAGAGLARGISSKAADVRNAAMALASAASGASAKQLKLGSPSKVMIQQGQWWSEGLAIGIKRFAYKASASAKDAASESTDVFGNALDTAMSTIDGDIRNPIIRPVLDLDEVKKEALTLGDILDIGELGIGMAATTARSAMKRPNYETVSEQVNQKSGAETTQEVNFVQNNYSPKTLSQLDIYRQTERQLARMKGVLVTQ